LPDDEPNRLSKLEYVSAMAQLQGRTKAFDLAVENIYREFRRRVSRLFGIDNHTATRKDLAKKIAERLNRDANEIEEMMYQCEDIMHGEPAKKKEIVNLISRLREIEEALGLRRGKNRSK
jgi:seryl-tRNA synthetase